MKPTHFNGFWPYILYCGSIFLYTSILFYSHCENSYYIHTHTLLNERKQCVNLNGTFSVLKCIDFGVPQGSLMGPLLFILFINDLPIHGFKSSFLIYADGTVFYYRKRNVNTIWREIQCELNILKLWCNFNRLSLHIEKAKQMVFSTKERHLGDLNCISIECTNIEYVDSP